MEAIEVSGEVIFDRSSVIEEEAGGDPGGPAAAPRAAAFGPAEYVHNSRHVPVAIFAAPTAPAAPEFESKYSESSVNEAGPNIWLTEGSKPSGGGGHGDDGGVGAGRTSSRPRPVPGLLLWLKSSNSAIVALNARRERSTRHKSQHIAALHGRTTRSVKQTARRPASMKDLVSRSQAAGQQDIDGR